MQGQSCQDEGPDVGQELREAASALRALQSAEAFTARYLSPPWLYLDWYRRIDQHLERNPMALFLVHPGSGKSTRVGLVQTLLEICRNRNTRIGYFSKTAGKASLFMGSIARELRSNPRLIQDFGQFYDPNDPEVIWSTEIIRVAHSRRGSATPTVINLGATSQVEGLRFDWLILDDPIDLHTALSGAETARMDKLLGTLIDRLDPGGRMIIIGHRFLPNDFYQQIIDTRPSIAPLILPAISPSGEVLAHELWPADTLTVEKKNRHRGWEWSAWFMQERVSPEDATFAGIPRKLVGRAPEGRITAVVDAAYTQADEGDWSVGVAGVADGSGGVVVTAIQSWRIAKGWSTAFNDFAVKAGASDLYVEVNNAQTLGEETRQNARRQALRHNVHDYRSRGKKTFRIGELAEAAKQGSISFLSSLERLDSYARLADEWDIYPNIQHDDHLDALDMLRRLVGQAKPSTGCRVARI